MENIRDAWYVFTKRHAAVVAIRTLELETEYWTSHSLSTKNIKLCEVQYSVSSVVNLHVANLVPRLLLHCITRKRPGDKAIIIFSIGAQILRHDV